MIGETKAVYNIVPFGTSMSQKPLKKPLLNAVSFQSLGMCEVETGKNLVYRFMVLVTFPEGFH